MTEDVSQMIMGYNTNEEISESLKEIYFNGIDFSEVYELSTEASRMTQDRKLVAVYFAKLKGIWQDIDQIRLCSIKFPDDAKIYKDEQDLMRVHVFLAGLDPIFENARSELLHWTTTPSLQQAFAYIRKDETQRPGTRAVTTEVEGLSIQSKPSNSSSNRLFSCNRPPTLCPFSQGPHLGFSSNVICNYCKNSGQIKANCHSWLVFQLVTLISPDLRTNPRERMLSILFKTNITML